MPECFYNTMVMGECRHIKEQIEQKGAVRLKLENCDGGISTKSVKVAEVTPLQFFISLNQLLICTSLHISRSQPLKIAVFIRACCDV